MWTAIDSKQGREHQAKPLEDCYLNQEEGRGRLRRSSQVQAAGLIQGNQGRTAVQGGTLRERGDEGKRRCLY